MNCWPWRGSTSNSRMASKLARRSRLRFDCDRHSVFGDTRSAFLLSCVATMFAAPAVPRVGKSSFSTAAVSGDLALRKPSRSRRRKKRNQTSSASSSSWVRSLGLGGNIPTQWMLKRQDAFHRPAHTRAAASDHRQAASNSRALLPAGSRYHRQESNRGTGTARRGVRGTSGGTTRADGRTGRAGITPLASHPSFGQDSRSSPWRGTGHNARAGLGSGARQVPA
jgi:hypothetical protein